VAESSSFGKVWSCESDWMITFRKQLYSPVRLGFGIEGLESGGVQVALHLSTFPAPDQDSVEMRRQTS